MGLFTRKRDAVVFYCGEMDEGGLEAFTQLVEQSPSWTKVFLVGYGTGPSRVDRVKVGRRTFDHLFYGPDELTDFDFPHKYGRRPDRFSLVPGNTDLLQIRFARDHPGFDRYWGIEDDVRFGGDWAVLFEHLRRSGAALIGTTMRRRPSDPHWHWWSGIKAPDNEPEPTDEDLVSSFLPFVAITPAGIAAVTAGYERGWQGHYEALWPTLMLKEGLTIRDIGGKGEFVAPGDTERFYTNTGWRSLAPGTFVYRPYHADYERTGDKIWHPLRAGRGPDDGF